MRYRPIAERIVKRDGNDRASSYPSVGITPQRLARIFRAADSGDVLEQMELFEEMEEKDSHLFSQLQTRKLAAASLEWEIQPFSDDERDKLIAEFVDRELRAIEEFDDMLFDLLDAIGKGISVMEIEWGVSKNLANTINNIDYVHPKRLVWSGVDDELKVRTKESPNGIPLPENKFIIHRHKAKSGYTSRNGILRVVAWMYLFKNYTVKDWVSFCEIFGMPLRLGKYSPTASDNDKKALIEAIYSLGTDAAGIVPDGTLIEFIESQKTTSVEIYEKLARYCDEQMSKAILGQTLSADAGGSYAQGKVHNEVRHDLTVADAKALETTIRRDLIRPLVWFNFGSDANLPFLRFDSSEAEDQKEIADIYKTLACDLGLKIPENHVYMKFNIPKPEAGESILAPQSKKDSALEENISFKLKNETEEGNYQEKLDEIIKISVNESEKIFEGMLAKIMKEVDGVNDLKELKEKLSDKKEVEKLYEKIESKELEDLLYQAVYVSSLIGRSMDE